VVLEPLSGVAAYPLKTAADAFAVADRVPRVALLFDLYHLAVNGDDIAAVIEHHADRIGHVQIADAPGRHEPGTGEVPLRQHLAALDAAGYAGWVGLEYVPSTTSERAFDWMKEQT
jgi:hydroxypyruvate isomerase